MTSSQSRLTSHAKNPFAYLTVSFHVSLHLSPLPTAPTSDELITPANHYRNQLCQAKHLTTLSSLIAMNKKASRDLPSKFALVSEPKIVS
ncbi:hypothetical protein L1887_35993 [Cichorium endivia]|nr:hypothetical protein L1887_35993 [Cichorium endivia]